jgi:hypothetical protein
MEKHSEESIIELLRFRFINGIRYKLSNAYIFKHDWETDFFIQQHASGYCYEIEIKISRSDFLADQLKKDKHSILKTGTYVEPVRKWNTDIRKFEVVENKVVQHALRPNRFYYCVPDGMISPAELPSYAGLMYVRNSNIITVKEAPFIHKEKLKLEQRLCNKFYHYWINSKSELNLLQHDHQMLRKQNEILCAKLKAVENQSVSF